MHIKKEKYLHLLDVYSYITKPIDNTMYVQI